MQVDILDKFIAKCFVQKWVVDDKLMMTWLQKCGKRVMLTTWAFKFCFGIINALWLIDAVDLQNLILIALLMKKIIPTFQL